MEKLNFLIQLKGISKILTDNDIEHDIPYCCIDKELFEHVYIIIPDHIENMDLLKMFNFEQVKESINRIDGLIEGIMYIFIKSSKQKWNYKFYYYSWDVLRHLINSIADKMDLEYNDNGLYYKPYNIYITDNLKDIFDFFELKFNFILNGLTQHLLNSYISASIYYNYEFFDMGFFEKIDPEYKYNKKLYEDLMGNLVIKKCVEIEKQHILDTLDLFFNKSNILENTLIKQFKEQFPKTKIGNVAKLINKPETEKIVKKKKINLKNITKGDDFKIE
jgi:hypothetical protein